MLENDCSSGAIPPYEEQAGDQAKPARDERHKESLGLLYSDGLHDSHFGRAPGKTWLRHNYFLQEVVATTEFVQASDGVLIKFFSVCLIARKDRWG